MDLDVNCKTTKLSGKNIAENLWNIGLGRVFRLETKSIIRKNKQMNFTSSKWKTLRKTSLRGWKDRLQTERKYLQTMYLSKDKYLKYINNSQNSTVAFCLLTSIKARWVTTSSIEATHENPARCLLLLPLLKSAQSGLEIRPQLSDSSVCISVQWDRLHPVGLGDIPWVAHPRHLVTKQKNNASPSTLSNGDNNENNKLNSR